MTIYVTCVDPAEPRFIAVTDGGYAGSQNKAFGASEQAALLELANNSPWLFQKRKDRGDSVVISFVDSVATK